MKHCAIGLVCILFVMLFSISGAQEINSTEGNHTELRCPTWFVWNETAQECSCGPNIDGVIQCKHATKEVWLNLQYCMTYDHRRKCAVIGECPFSALQKSDYGSIKNLLPDNLTRVNDSFCGRVNREGLLCSKCKPGYGPPMLLYGVKCTKCSQSRYSWLLFLLLSCIPTAIFFFIIVLCQVRTTSASLNGFILGCHLMSMIPRTYPQYVYSSSGTTRIFLSILTSIFSLWNLDFFPFIIPAFCVSEHLSNLQVLCMEYIAAFFPLFLITVTYICIQQHARGRILLICLWKPFDYCLTPLTKRLNLNPAESIVHVFASFLVLSSTKILFVSFSLIKKTTLYTNNLSKSSLKYEHTSLLFNDASIAFFSKEHLPYAFLAITVSTIFVAVPCVTLMLYPTRLFQKCLNRCRFRWHALHVFADAFNGCYKDGLNGTRDYRCFAGFYLLLRICFLLIELTPTPEYLTVQGILVVTTLLIFALVSPYKANYFNILDSLWISLCAYSFIPGVHVYQQFMYIFICVALIVYFIAYVFCRIIFKLKFSWCRKLKAFADKLTETNNKDISPNLNRQYDLEESFPDRILNPEHYAVSEDDNETQQLVLDSTNSVIPTYGGIIQ